MVKRAVIIKVGAIGDTVMALPLARALKEKGLRELHWLSGRDPVPVLERVPEIDRIWTLDERKLYSRNRLQAVWEVFKVWKTLLRIRPDSAYLLHGDRRYKLFLLPFRFPVLQSQPRPDRHHSFDYERLADPTREDRELGCKPYVLKSGAKQTNRICLFPGGAKNALRDDALRRWPTKHYVRLAELLIESGSEVIIAGSPSDSWITPLFSHLMSRLDWQVGTLPLSKTIDLMAECAVVVSHDSGPMHLASFLDVPVVSLFGPTTPDAKFPLKFAHLVLEAERLPCQPCYDGSEYGLCTNNICLSRILPESVLEKVRLALRRAK